MSIDFDKWVAVSSLAIPLAAFLWEFAVVGRKRLGYRVQMDTLAADATQSEHAEVLERLERDGHRLKDPSFVLLRIENAGSAPIESGDYLTHDDDPCGIRVTFRRRQVAGLVVTELSQPELRNFFRRGARGYGFYNDDEPRAGVVELPKVKLPRQAQYKVLVVLERWPGDDTDDPFGEPEFLGAVGGDRRWFDPLSRFGRFKVARTESHVFASRPAWIGIGVLAAAVVAQSVTLLVPEHRAPLDCVGGTLHLHGSTAFAPAVREAAAKYEEACKEAGVSIPLEDGTFGGSSEGIEDLEDAGRARRIPVGDGLADHLTFTDGPAGDNHPRLKSRPVAYSAYTLVVNKSAGVENLTTAEVRGILAGRIRNWSELHGNDVPLHVVNRHLGSGTRNALVERVLGGREPAQGTVRECAEMPAKAYARCEVGDTDALLEAVGRTAGGVGYSEVRAAEDEIQDDTDLVKVTIDNQEASLDGVENGDYPYWQTEFAYTYGDPPAGSIAAAFLTYLSEQGGRDVLREYGSRLCSEVDKPRVCEPN